MRHSNQVSPSDLGHDSLKHFEEELPWHGR
jgi:hypothetical protein